jgi:hypothetical protein
LWWEQNKRVPDTKNPFYEADTRNQHDWCEYPVRFIKRRDIHLQGDPVVLAMGVFVYPHDPTPRHSSLYAVNYTVNVGKEFYGVAAKDDGSLHWSVSS